MVRLSFSRILFLSLLAVFMPLDISAQYPFGKNKVIYKNRDWKVLKTDHVDVYHYAADANLIRYVAPLVEETYLEFSETFDVDFRRRLPFVFYASHYDFQQTNIIPYLISEYTGGFTDLMKGRIAVPFTGSYANFRHVVRHEMVHAFMLEKLQQVMKEAGKYTYTHPPLWFVEGMAEYFAASPQGRQGNMFVRDALLNDRMLSLDEIWRIQGSFLMYKQGEAVINYIANNFGSEAVVQILENWWTADKFTLVLLNTINMSLTELSEAFTRHVKRKYYPTIMHMQFASEIGEKLTPRRSFHSRSSARFDDDGNLELYALCAEDGAINVCRLRFDEHGQEDHSTVVKGSRSPDFESIPAFRSKLEVKGDTLIFVSKSGSRDALYMWDVREERMIDRFTFSNLALLASPTLSGDGSRMVFSAIDSTGLMDLFMYEFQTEKIVRLTTDGFSEEDPDFHPTENVILFTSDRGAGTRKETTHIYKMDLDTREIQPIEGGAHADAYPEWAPDGKSFLFVSDREGTQNVYRHKGNVIVRQTNAIGGVTAPTVVPDGNSFIATVYEKGEFNLFEFPMRNGAGRVLSVLPADTTVIPWSREDYETFDFEMSDYRTSYAIDFVGVGISVDPEFGEVGNGGALAMTDVLGNHQIRFFFGTTTNDFDDFFQNISVGLTWVNQSRRVNYSVSIFNLNSVNRNDFITDQREKRVGGALGLSYALNKFQRLDGTFVVRHVERGTEFFHDIVNGRSSVTSSVFLTFVNDTSLWAIGGPAVSWRFYITAGQTVDWYGRGFSNTNLLIDFRKYVKLTRRSVFAVRYITRNTFGTDEQVYYLGGPWTLRGFGYRQFFGRTLHLVNSEIRFPLIDRFALTLPFGIIEMPMFRGSFFYDVGKTDRNQFEFFDSGWRASLGGGIELNLGYAPIVRVNFTRQFISGKLSPSTGFELFIGYNY